MKKKQKLKNTELAKLHSVSTRTITNWRRENAPLEDPAKLRAWLAVRKNIPPHMANDAERNDGATIVATDAGPQGTGAAQALLRLEKAELAAYQKLQRALADDDALAIRAARESWLRIAESLRHYERAVAQEKRDLGVLVNRQDVERALNIYSTCITQAFEGAMPTVLRAVQAEPDVHRARKILRRVNWHSVSLGLAAGMLKNVPLWISDAFSAHLQRTVTGDFQADVATMAGLMRKFGEATAEITIQQTPKYEQEN